MPPKKSKGKTLNDEYSKLTRPPLRTLPNLYPDLHAEKENMDLSSSDDSPEKKIPDSHSPRMPRKNNSPSSTDYIQDTTNISRHRIKNHQQRAMNAFHDSGIQNVYLETTYSENSDVDMEIDDSLDNQRQETSKNSQGIKKCVSPKSGRCEDSIKVRGDSDQPDMQNHKLYPSWEGLNKRLSKYFANKSIHLFLLFTIILVGFFMAYGYLSTSNKSDPLNATTVVKNLKSDFKDQPALTFRIISSALKNVLMTQPTSPAIILLLATNGSQTVCSNFAESLVNSLSTLMHSAKISGKKYKQVNANQAKLEIDKIIRKALDINQMGSILINDLDQIPGQAAIILHKYFDHENAPFKKAVFVMTVNYNKPISDYESTKVWDKAANDHLHSVWTDTGIDQLSALLSRLTVSVAVITTKTV